MAVEILTGYVNPDVFLNRLENICIKRDFRIEEVHEPPNPSERIRKSTFNILRGDNIEYKLEQMQEESLPNERQRYGRYSSVLCKVNGSSNPVIESYQAWDNCSSSNGENGSSERRTSLYQEDELGRAVFEELKPILK